MFYKYLITNPGYYFKISHRKITFETMRIQNKDDKLHDIHRASKQ